MSNATSSVCRWPGWELPPGAVLVAGPVLRHRLEAALPLGWAVVEDSQVTGVMNRGPGRSLHAARHGWLWDGVRPEPSPAVSLQALRENLADALRRAGAATTACRIVVIAECPASGALVEPDCQEWTWLAGQPAPAPAPGAAILPREALLAALYDPGAVRLPPLDAWRVHQLRRVGADHLEYLATPLGAMDGAPPRRLTLLAAPPTEALAWRCRLVAKASSHPHVVDYSTSRPNDLLLQEALSWEPDAPSLAELLRLTPLALDEVLATVDDVATALLACHDAGVAHGQLSPDSLEMGAQGTRLAGFALPVPTPWRAAASPFVEPDTPEWPPLPGRDWYALAAIGEELLTDADLPDGLAGWLTELRASSPERRTAAAAQAPERLRLWRQLPPPVDWLPPPVPDPAAANPVLHPGQLVGDYRIVRYRRQGGYAQVYEAVHVLQNRRYALKVYHRDVPTDEAAGEFSLLARLRHPHVLRAHWSGRLPDGRAYLVLDFLDGQPWSEFAWGDCQLPVTEALELAAQALDAMACLHDAALKDGPLAGRSILHRDLKPANLFAVPGLGTVVIDFNSAAVSGAAPDFDGTPRYVPPDLRDAHGVRWDASADTYALGVSLYEVLCRRPFGPDGGALLDEPPPWPAPVDGPPLPEAVAAFVHRATQPRATDRFATAAAMADALAEAQAASGPPRLPLPRIPLVRDTNPFVEDLRTQAMAIDAEAGFAEAELLGRHLLELAAPDRWRECLGCRWRGQCVIHYNAMSVGPHPAGATIRRRLTGLLRQLALPLPADELRRLAAWLIGRRLACADLPAHLAATAPLDRVRLAYWNLAEPLAETPPLLPLLDQLRASGSGHWRDPANATALARLPLDRWPALDIADRPEWPRHCLADALAGTPASVALARRIQGLLARWMFAEHRPGPLEPALHPHEVTG